MLVSVFCSSIASAMILVIQFVEVKSKQGPQHHFPGLQAIYKHESFYKPVAKSSTYQ
jgi:hypothetical protein